ncbi:tetratricopeptide repeat protein [Helicobacter salomonis]|uniref:tetratricopeptide repeat protein n=1 Tax=Helicobacter salomonis TaxID=56878 RepID=UPI0013159CCB|nr:tetratricopeptide repeat protein [Helicobacter salomonis]
MVDEPQNNPKKSLFPSLIQAIRGVFSHTTYERITDTITTLKSRPKLLYGVGGGVLALVLLIVGLSIMTHYKHRNERKELLETEGQLQKEREKSASTQEDELAYLPTLSDANSIPLSNEEEINALITKADILYQRGQHQEALKIFNDISRMSSSIANHNLGVIKMREHDYTGALAAFNNAIQSGQNTSVNAINAMVASFYLNNMDLYTRYLKLTMQHLPEIAHQPVYAYAYSLGLYYGGHYFETLSTLTHSNSTVFKPARQRLASKIYLLFGDAKNALDNLNSIATHKDQKALGLLYARLGRYTEALEHLRRYANQYPDDLSALMAMEIISLKVGDFPEVSNILGFLSQHGSNDPNELKILSDTYPIVPVLNARFFDINTVRRDFWENNFRESIGLPIYRIFFYYAPFKLVDVKRGLQNIQEGVSFVDTDGIKDFQRALKSLETGNNISISNQYTIAALKDIGKSHLRSALNQLKLALQANPNNAVSHYNMALVYAQLEDFNQASFHFKKSYHLDSRNVLAGIFTVLAGRLNYEDTSAFLKHLTTDFQAMSFSDKIQRAFLHSFIAYLNNANNDDLEWLNRVQRPLKIYYALNIAYAHQAQDKRRLVSSFKALQAMQPNNMLTNLFYQMMLKYRADIKQMLGAYAFLTDKNMDWEELMHGPLLARKMYIYLGFITGLLNQQEETLTLHLSATQDKELSTDLMRMLGLISIFQKKYEKAISIFNFLINKRQEIDAEPLMLASLANIALKRYSDAALILEFAKTQLPGNYDIRYGLGLLYQQAGNLEASLNHFGAIKDKKFQSTYLDFALQMPTNRQDFRTPKLLQSIHAASKDLKSQTNSTSKDSP